MTAIVLREDYQTPIIQQVRAALKRVKRVLIQAPTGAGKTVMAAYIIDGTRQREQSAWFICHRAELIEGSSKTFGKFGIHHGIIAGGFPTNLQQLVQVCSIDTLKNRLDKLKAPRVAIIDEAHHSSAAGWALVVEWLTANGSIIIGLSATPQRLDGIGLCAHFDEIVLGPKVSWLIEQGFLSTYLIYAPSAPDMTGVRKQMGDFAKGQTAERMNKPKLTGDAVTHWKKHAGGLRTVAFGMTKAHSNHIADLFNSAGVPAAHLDGDTPKGIRKKVIQDYADGRLKVLTNVGLFGEGFDLSAIAQRDVTIDAVVDLAPTMSLSAYLQRGGRMLRPYPGKVGIYLDHAGNSSRHGFFDDEREWSLDGRSRSDKDNPSDAPAPPITCDKCFRQIRRPVPDKCPGCGKLLQKETPPPEVSDGELTLQTEAEKRKTRAKLKQEVKEAKDLGALVALASRRGYTYPTQWANHEMARRDAWRGNDPKKNKEVETYDF